MQAWLAALDVNFTLVAPNKIKQEWSPRREFENEYGLRGESAAQAETLAFEYSRAAEREYVYALERNRARYRQRDAYAALRHRRPDLMAPPDWLSNYCEGVASHMIETQRLVVGTETEEPGGKRRNRPAVQEYREDLAKNIKDTLAENSKTAARLDRTFPRRIMVDTPLDDSVTDAEIRSAFETQRKKRAALSRVGLADNAEELPLPDRVLEPLERKVLWTYLADMDKKLRTFDALLARLERFVDIVNSKFLYKGMQIDPDLGFTIKTASGRAVPPDGLSSGEQHELVLAYNLLFKTVPGSLVLIDEPEISLHVVWQQQFIADLETIAEVVPMQFIIATHSPQVINKWWDRAIALEPDPSLFA
ncbi:hypothetical protein GCM10011509_34910 [Ornithinimicrobium pekingense]|uniref:ATPase AAA-type core domain-containing protein n=1 Tax=Ornithinimicrobium pekingense TaxID=384677 RepID=A0ABQ2FCG1_9MICO|nr:hypothetical protein GCM10011509_34910 [Ornithinimicrobium pekingense]